MTSVQKVEIIIWGLWQASSLSTLGQSEDLVFFPHTADIPARVCEVQGLTLRGLGVGVEGKTGPHQPHPESCSQRGSQPCPISSRPCFLFPTVLWDAASPLTWHPSPGGSRGQMREQRKAKQKSSMLKRRKPTEEGRRLRAACSLQTPGMKNSLSFERSTEPSLARLTSV